MALQPETVAHAALVGGSQTTLHSHAGGGGESEIAIVATQDSSNATTSFANITDLSFTAAVGKTYIIEAWLVFQSNTAGCGIKFALNGPPSPAIVALIAHVPIALTLYASCVTLASRAYDTGTPSVSVDTINANLLCKIDALVKNGSTQGSVTLRFAAETTGTVKVMTGSVLRYRQVD